MKRGKRIGYTCQFCGRKWEADTKTPGADTGWTGFLAAAVRHHEAICERRTPEERYRLNKRDVQRWKKRPPQHTLITLDWNHPGVQQ